MGNPIDLSAIIWTLIGIIFGIVLILVQNTILKTRIDKNLDRFFRETAIFSILKILFVLGDFIISLKTGLINSLFFLVFFIIFRWVALFIISKVWK